MFSARKSGETCPYTLKGRVEDIPIPCIDLQINSQAQLMRQRRMTNHLKQSIVLRASRYRLTNRNLQLNKKIPAKKSDDS
jgi:hypothetical protein